MILFGILLIATISFAETHIPEGDVSGIWSIGGSPYIIDGEINIPVDSTLTIEPGVQVLFSGHYKFNIYGRILAIGTEEYTIVFTAQDITTGWHSLRFWDTSTNGQDSSKVVYCKLEYGKATGSLNDRYGGTIYCNNSSDILIRNCLITKNTAESHGGGIYCSSSSPSLENVTISGNLASYGGGGGIFCEDSTPSLSNVTISGNSASWNGGGIYCSSSSPSLCNVTISGNSAHFGGGISCGYDSSPSLENMTISRNSASLSGGGVYCLYSSPILSNVTISGNSAYYGGGIYCGYDSSPSFDPLNRCNIFLNSAGSGNDLYAYYPSTTINVIVDTFTVLYPNDYFAYPIDNFTFDIQHSKVEQVNQDLYVSPDGSDDNSGLTVEDPLLTICYALTKIIADSTNPNTIHLSNGTYSPSQTGEIFPLNCKNYVSLQGIEEHNTILDGGGISKILYCYNDNNFSIEYLTIQNGSSLWGGDGGGIHCYNSSPSLENVTIRNNHAGTGGGIYCYDSSLSLKDVIISGNDGNTTGGGICCYSSNLSLKNVTISENTSLLWGSGIHCSNSSPTLENVTISENSTSADYGSGFYCSSNSNPILINCILWNDSPREIAFWFHGDPNTITISYSDIQDGEDGIVTNNTGTVFWLEGNIDANPLFADPQNGDFHLTWANFPTPDSTKSPCIDAGDPTSPLDPDSTRADMGAYYFDQNQQGVEEMPILPTRCLLYQNYPNPFSPDNIVTTTISFNLATNYRNLHEQARIKIYNIKGQLVKNFELRIPNSEFTNIIWDGKDEKGQALSSGIYFYTLEINNKIIDIKKCLLMK